MATHSRVLAWRIPGTEEPGGLPSMGSHRVKHDWSHTAAAAAKASEVQLFWSQKLLLVSWATEIYILCPCSCQYFNVLLSVLSQVFIIFIFWFSSVQSLSRVQLFVTPWIAARQASLSITNSRSSPRLTSIESVMPSSHLILWHPFLLLPPIPPSIRVFSNESTLRMRWPKYWSFSFSIIPSKEIPGLISFRNGLVGSPCTPRDSQESSPTPQFKSHQFFCAQPSSQSNSHIHTWPQERP